MNINFYMLPAIDLMEFTRGELENSPLGGVDKQGAKDFDYGYYFYHTVGEVFDLEPITDRERVKVIKRILDANRIRYRNEIDQLHPSDFIGQKLLLEQIAKYWGLSLRNIDRRTYYPNKPAPIHAINYMVSRGVLVDAAERLTGLVEKEIYKNVRTGMGGNWGKRFTRIIDLNYHASPSSYLLISQSEENR